MQFIKRPLSSARTAVTEPFFSGSLQRREVSEETTFSPNADSVQHDIHCAIVILKVIPDEH